MGRAKRGGKRENRDRKKRTKEEWEEMKRQNPDLEKDSGYKLIQKTNANFETFYEGIGIVPEGEWEAFMESMRQPLPTTFRITGSRSQARELLKIIKGQYFSKFISREDSTSSLKLEPISLPWYPDELAWQLEFTKKQIKTDRTLKHLHSFLISETESGNISRQEAVSMLPPLLMEIEPHHKILDMCAAPGSKTAQLIEMLHSDDSIAVPDGYVVANDMDNKRCYLMTHQVKRIQSPNCMIINHDARILPNMYSSNDQNAEFVKYDRILCDVPCSGDGTLRKNPDIWKKWHVNGAYNLHRIQKKVLQRGIELLAVGGRLVYSTCSLNPVENEAVILTLLKQCDGAVELVDISDKLTGLKYCKGTYSWKIMSKTKSEWYETLENAPAQFKDCWDSTMFPPLITEAQEAKLERCIRVLPHQQNTGAFFIAVLEKTKELPWLSGRKHKRMDPIINPKTRLDDSEKKDPGSEHFTFGVRATGGLYKYARCDLCNITLQGRNDYNSHRQGRRHLRELTKQKTKSVREEEVNIEITLTDSLPVSMETDNASGNLVAENSAQTEISENADKMEISEVTTIQLEMSNGDTESGAGTTFKQMDQQTKEENAADEQTKEQTATESDKQIDEHTIEQKDEATEADKQMDEHAIEQKEEATEADKQMDEHAIEQKEEATEAEKQTKEETEELSGAGPSGDTTQDGPPPAKKVKMDNPDIDSIKVVMQRMQGHREDPFIFCNIDDPIWPDIKEFYDISEDFGVEQIMYRNMKRVLYYVSKPIRNLVICNSERVKFINLGVKCFSNAPSPLVPECDYRLSQEGLLAIQHHVRARRVVLTKKDVVVLLSEENPFIYKLCPIPQEHVYAMDPGSVIFHFKPTESDPEPNVEIVFCGWRGKTSVRSFVSRDERSHFLRLCGVELTDIQSKVQQKKTSTYENVSGTETPVGIPSGDEAELEQWNKEVEAPRGTEADDVEEGSVNTEIKEEEAPMGTVAEEVCHTELVNTEIKKEHMETEKNKDVHEGSRTGSVKTEIKQEEAPKGTAMDVV